MLKAPIKVRVKGVNIFKKALKIEKGRQWSINEQNNRTNKVSETLSANEENCPSYFLHPQYCKSRILGDSANNCIIVPRKCRSEE